MNIKTTLNFKRDIHRNDSSVTSLFDYSTYAENAPLKSF